MADYKLSVSCEIDLAEIYLFGFEHFGINQARTYLLELHDLFQRIAKNPAIGIKADELAAGLRKFNYRAHTVFYQIVDQDILVIRTLSQKASYSNKFNG